MIGVRVRRRGSRIAPVLMLATAAVAISSVVAGRDRRVVEPIDAPPLDTPRKHIALTLTSIRTLVLCAIGVAFLITAWFAYPRDIHDRPTFNSPRESIGYFLTDRFIDGEGFSAPLLHYDDLPEDVAMALTPRDAASVDGNVVPKDFPGTMLLYAAVMWIHPSLALLVAPVFALLGAWALMRIGEDLFGKTAGFVACCLWLSFPPLWINASYIFAGDLPALAFFLLTVMTFVRYWRAPTVRGVALMAACFLASVLLRYPNVVLALPFVAALLAGRRLVPKHILVAMVVACPFVATVLIFNQLVYGDPLTTGFHLGGELVRNTVNYSEESLFKRRPDVLLQYVRTYGALPILSVPIGLGLVGCAAIAAAGSGLRKVFALLALTTFAIFLVYYGQQDAWGYKSAHLNASFLRYLLPAFALLILFGAALLVAGARRYGRYVYALPVALIVLGAWSTHTGPGGAIDAHNAIASSEELRDQVLAATEPDAVIAVRIMDKVLFPYRQTLTLTYAVHNEQPVPKGDLETWDAVPSPERFADIAARTWDAGVKLYFLPDARVGHVAPYQVALHERGFYLRRIEAVDAAALYLVRRDRFGAR